VQGEEEQARGQYLVRGDNGVIAHFLFSVVPAR
jgi:hypothetical protein